jgi:hypothetical protein
MKFELNPRGKQGSIIPPPTIPQTKMAVKIEHNFIEVFFGLIPTIYPQGQ